MSRLRIEFGAMAPPLATQLDGHGVDVPQVLLCQRFADSITLLKVHGLLTETETKKVRRRLLARIAGAVVSPAPGTTGEGAEP